MARRSRSKQKRSPARFNGVALIDKQAGMTSHDVVDRVRAVAKQRQVGHTGSLDPAATGLLVVCLGNATKIAEYLTLLPKVYEGQVTLGSISDTYDGDGEVVKVEDWEGEIERAELQEAAQHFVGKIEQVPPIHSAKKVAGRRLYEYARAGEEVKIEARIVEVQRFDITSLTWPEATFEVACGSGTYVRRLVHDLGEDLRCGGYLSSLRRLEVAQFHVRDSLSLDDLKTEQGQELLAGGLLTLSQALSHFPKAQITDKGFQLLRQGHALPVGWAPFVGEDPGLDWLDRVLIVDSEDRALAVANYVPAPSSPPPRELNEYDGVWLQPVKRFSLSN